MLSSGRLTTKIKFSLEGAVLNKVVETLLSDNCVIRRTASSECIIKANKMVFNRTKVLLRPLRRLPLFPHFVRNPNIGVIDTETYRCDTGLSSRLVRKPKA